MVQRVHEPLDHALRGLPRELDLQEGFLGKHSIMFAVFYGTVPTDLQEFDGGRVDLHARRQGEHYRLRAVAGGEVGAALKRRREK